MMIKNFIIIIFYFTYTLSAQLISPDRKIEWNPGILNGIPEIKSPIKNVLNYGADPSGSMDSYSAFMSAINNIPEDGGVVLIPAGTYKIEKTIIINRDKIVFKGEGIDKTKLLMYTDGTSFKVEAFGDTPWRSLRTKHLKGTSEIFVNNPEDFDVGLFVEIRQENDPIVMYTKPEWEQPWSYHSVGQIFEVKSVNNNQIEFVAPFNFDLDTSLNPQMKIQKLVKNVGFEGFYIEKKIATGHTFSFRNTAYCWIKNVESHRTRRSHIYLSSSLGNEIRNSYFHASFDYGGGGNGYGIKLERHVTNCLIENNVFDSLRHAMVVQVGANGNVFGYNFSTNPIHSEGNNKLNEGWIPPDISIHGHYPFMNLFEGNYVEEIGISDWFGPAGPGNTFFRNYVNGEGIFYKDHSNDQNIIGNQTTAIISDSTSKNVLEIKNIIDSKLKVNSPITEEILSPSLYYNNKPEFLKDISWPVFGPNSTGNEILPAQKVWAESESKL